MTSTTRARVLLGTTPRTRMTSRTRARVLLGPLGQRGRLGRMRWGSRWCRLISDLGVRSYSPDSKRQCGRGVPVRLATVHLCLRTVPPSRSLPGAPPRTPPKACQPLSEPRARQSLRALRHHFGERHPPRGPRRPQPWATRTNSLLDLASPLTGAATARKASSK